MVKKTLGAILRRRLEKEKQSGYEQAVAMAGTDGPAVQTDRKSKALVAAMFRSARTRVRKIVGLGAPMPELSLILGTDGVEQNPVHAQAILTLKNACWPMTIPEGLKIPGTAYHFEWEAMTAWAASEDLTVEIGMKVNDVVASTTFLLVVKPK